MPTVFFITHPEVVVDPNIPVPQWRLSERGIARMTAFAASSRLASVAAIWSSAEVKAVEAAAILAAKLGLTASIEPDLHENDRSATGFLPPDEFERMADAFFAKPEQSIRGWERAIDAQARIVNAVKRILAAHAQGNIAFVAHGGVGTLLQCHLLGEAISRRFDQPSQGHVFAFDLATLKVIHGWKKLEEG
jgi:broad specificity phosphatase PhoE